MPAQKPRLDTYGYPLPDLVDARHESFYDRAFNTQQRHLMHETMEQVYHEVLRRDVTAKVTLEFTVKDGTLYYQFFLGVEYTHAGPGVPEEVRLQEQADRREARRQGERGRRR